MERVEIERIAKDAAQQILTTECGHRSMGIITAGSRMMLVDPKSLTREYMKHKSMSEVKDGLIAWASTLGYEGLLSDSDTDVAKEIIEEQCTIYEIQIKGAITYNKEHGTASELYKDVTIYFDRLVHAITDEMLKRGLCIYSICQKCPR